MSTIGTLAFNEACQRVMHWAGKNSKRYTVSGPMAYVYARAGLHMTDREMIRVQALYILSNLQGWRGEEARMVKATLKHFADIK